MKIISYQDQDQTFVDLLAGRIDVVIAEKPNGIAGLLNKPEGKDYEFVGEQLDHPLLANRIGLGLRKQDKQLKADVDAAIAELQKEGVITALAKKYFAEGELDFLGAK